MAPSQTRKLCTNDRRGSSGNHTKVCWAGWWTHESNTPPSEAGDFSQRRPIASCSSRIHLDAAGLALFAVAGTEKALAYRMPPFIAMLMGTTTGVGGGTIRDVLLARVPTILHSDVYAIAAFAGALVLVAARYAGLSRMSAGIAGGAVCFLLRIVSVAAVGAAARAVKP